MVSASTFALSNVVSTSDADSDDSVPSDASSSCSSTSNTDRSICADITIDTELFKQRYHSSLRLLTTWEGVARRYGHITLEQDDEVDLSTGQLVKDRGVLRAMKDKTEVFEHESEQEGIEATRDDLEDDDQDDDLANVDLGGKTTTHQPDSIAPNKRLDSLHEFDVESLTPFLHNIIPASSSSVPTRSTLDEDDLKEFLAEEAARCGANDAAYHCPVTIHPPLTMRKSPDRETSFDTLLENSSGPQHMPPSLEISQHSRPSPKARRTIRFAATHETSDCLVSSLSTSISDVAAPTSESYSRRPSQPRHRTLPRRSLKALISRSYVDAVFGPSSGAEQEEKPVIIETSLQMKIKREEDDEREDSCHPHLDASKEVKHVSLPSVLSSSTNHTFLSALPSLDIRPLIDVKPFIDCKPFIRHTPYFPITSSEPPLTVSNLRPLYGSYNPSLPLLSSSTAMTPTASTSHGAHHHRHRSSHDAHRRYGRDANMTREEFLSLERQQTSKARSSPIPLGGAYERRDVADLGLTGVIIGHILKNDDVVVPDHPVKRRKRSDASLMAFERWEPYGASNALPAAVFARRLWG